jgi:putative redox protein
LLYARRNKWGLEGVEVDVRHAPRAAADGRDRIEVTLALGGDLTAEQSARLREISRRCPVHRMLAGGVEIVEAGA